MKVTTQINSDPNQGRIKPEWIRVTDAVRVSGMSRSKIYELIKAGKIRSFSKRERGAIRGMRLIFLDSLLDHIEEMYAVATANREGSINAKLEREVANDQVNLRPQHGTTTCRSMPDQRATTQGTSSKSQRLSKPTTTLQAPGGHPIRSN